MTYSGLTCHNRWLWKGKKALTYGQFHYPCRPLWRTEMDPLKKMDQGCSLAQQCWMAIGRGQGHRIQAQIMEHHIQSTVPNVRQKNEAPSLSPSPVDTTEVTGDSHSVDWSSIQYYSYMRYPACYDNRTGRSNMHSISIGMFTSAPGKHSNIMVKIRTQFGTLLHKWRDIKHDASSSPSIDVKCSEWKIARQSRRANVNEFKLTNQIFPPYRGKPGK
jgi:hypothetical protein